jgi:hypothetical protein
MTSQTARMHEFTWKDDAKADRPRERTSYDSSDEYVRTESFIPWLLSGLASLVLVIGATAVISLSGRPSLGAGPEALQLDRNWEETLGISPIEAARAFNPPAAKAPVAQAPAAEKQTPVVPKSDEAPPSAVGEPVEWQHDVVAPHPEVPAAPSASPIDNLSDEQSPPPDTDNPY